MADKSDRTEKPTERRLEKAREEGRVVSSRQLLVAIQLAVAYAYFFQDLGDASSRLAEAWMRAFREVFVEQTTRDALMEIVAPTRTEIIPWLASMVGIVAAANLATQLFASQGLIRGQNLAPKPAKLFSPQKLLEGWKGLPKTLPLFLGASCLFVVASLLPGWWGPKIIWGLRNLPVASQVAIYGEAVGNFVRYALALFVVVGLADFAWKLKTHQEELKMTKQEVKEESKDSNGNPLIKSAIRRRMKAMLANRMMQKVPEATVVVVNPTHYAVALQYDPASSDAPMVTAKGLDFLALRIRRKAEESGVPVVENPPLAQALYRSAEVGQKIPIELYRAVAEVLAYVFRVLGKSAPTV
ncbi:MAG: EscU/YscU/HrcU family type III secretion system export apparatus switch protein [Bryobacter sp.]|nr:EscU/YscU/HrcU family type III secretion system export apparatus switch protein [Bryobacter sp.]